MSQKNMEIVRAAHDAWNKGDIRSVLDRLDPEVEWWENPDVYPGLDRLYVGHDGFLKRERDAFDAWESFKIADEEFIDAGESVVVSLRVTGKGRHSGIEVATTVYECFTVRNGKVVRRSLHASREEARTAAVLTE